jgi:hypothetical protein
MRQNNREKKEKEMNILNGARKKINVQLVVHLAQ